MSGAEVESERCLLRDWRGDDAERVFDIYRRWEVAQWLGREPKAMESIDQAHKLIAGWSALNGADTTARRWAVERKVDGILAGTVVLVPLPDGAGEFEVGWHFHPDSWGMGLATETAAAAMAWGFEGGLDEIFAVVKPGNQKSIDVCRRLGMAALGRTSMYYGAELELFRASVPGR
jgi:RimJ/RimL family protein N-acetyltransferase